jgi:hypothetical protein
MHLASRLSDHNLILITSIAVISNFFLSMIVLFLFRAVHKSTRPFKEKHDSYENARPGPQDVLALALIPRNLNGKRLYVSPRQSWIPNGKSWSDPTWYGCELRYGLEPDALTVRGQTVAQAVDRMRFNDRFIALKEEDDRRTELYNEYG